MATSKRTGSTPDPGQEAAAEPSVTTATMRADRDAPAAARDLVRSFGTGLDEDLLRRAQLAVSELVTNAVIHGSRSEEQIRIRLTRNLEGLDVTITDSGSGQPDGVSGEGGFGLHIAATVAESMHVDTDGGWTVTAKFLPRTSDS